ncbi:DoxX family protein [Mycolicibacterium brisbanense]|uniref:DoxX family protein n=1 Tax=Mycolicibacterium brisbanense TaxID=146020 RepID=A0A117I413_9MYCO|nr:DoxX family protein [Mycolicibacterium brisbanense]MCV7161341.1 DoxX family protein [Mycolicibacterium brisbanense]GAS86192.1 uncharacterized protein, precursor [Mycolicibacterium brisbanense]
MHTAFIVASIVLALEMAASGVPKVLQIGAVRTSAEHLGVSVALDRMIGISQIAAAVGLLLGIAFPTLSVVTGVAVCLQMCGAVGYHIKAQDKIVAMLPAVATAAVAVVIVLAAVPAIR